MATEYDLKRVVDESPTNYPPGVAFATHTDQQLRDWINTLVDDPVIATPAEKVWDAIVESEYVALTDQERERVDKLFQTGAVDLAIGERSADIVVATFGGGSQTVDNLQALAIPQRTIWEVEGFPIWPKTTHFATARSL